MYTIKLFGVHSREQMIQSLKDKLNLSNSDIFYDDRPNGGFPIYTAKKAWLSPIQDGETHRLVIQDDIEVCNGFKDIVAQIIKTHPDKVISLFPFHYQKRYKELDELTTPYVNANTMSGCAIIMPTKYIKECFEWIDENMNGNGEDDWCIHKFCQYKGIDVITTIPSIIQHIGDESLLGHQANIKTEYYEENPIANWSNKEIKIIKNNPIELNFKLWRGGKRNASPIRRNKILDKQILFKKR